MKTFLLVGLVMSLTSYANTSYAPNDGSARPGNPGTFSTPKADMGKTTQSSNTDPATEDGKANLEKVNPSPNPIPTDTTLQGKNIKQSQEATEEEIDYRAIPKVDHSDGEGEPTDNQ